MTRDVGDIPSATPLSAVTIRLPDTNVIHADRADPVTMALAAIGASGVPVVVVCCDDTAWGITSADRLERAIEARHRGVSLDSPP